MSRNSKLLAFSNMIYGLLLYAYPASFRREYGYHMAQLFRDDTRRTLRECGLAALISLWFLVLFDLGKTVVAEHIWEVVPKSIEKLAPWSAPAAVIGGILWSLPWSGWLGEISPATQLWLALPALLLVGVGFIGLFRQVRVHASRNSKIAICLVLIGLLLMVSSVLTGLIIEVGEAFESSINLLPFVLLGGFMMALGIIGMGIITITKKALGFWSFVPLALAVVYFCYLITVSLYANTSFIKFLNPIFSTLTITGWMLLAIALWNAQKPRMLLKES